MRLFSGKVPVIADDIIETLSASGDVELEDAAEARLDLEAVLKEAASWGVKELPQGPNWLQLPDGLALELMQATGNAVAEVLAVDPRA